MGRIVPEMSQPPEPGHRPGLLDITRQLVEGVAVVVASGEVDLVTAPILREAVLTALDDDTGRPCILDLTAVTFLDSTGLTALVQATGHAQARREPLRIVVDSNRPVIRPIQLTGLDEALALYHSVTEALNAEQ